MEQRLWRICEKLRGGVEVHQYKNVVLPLIFLRYADTIFEKRLAEIATMKHFDGELLPEFFNDFATKNSGIFLPNEARWEYLLRAATSEVSNLSAKIDRALKLITETNPKLSDIFAKNFYTSQKLDRARLSKLILEIDKLDFSKDKSADFFGHVYEYLLLKFSAKESR